MFDPILEGAAQILNVFYTVVPNYAIAIALMTLLVMVVTTPLTLKGTRSMIKLQLLQPQVKRIQQQHKDDRQKMNEEMMRFYQENEVNPLGGCFPLLIQAPVFLLLFRVIQGLTRTGDGGGFDPQYLSENSELGRALSGETEMLSFGLDLAESTTQALSDSIIHGLPYLALIGVMTAASYLQQKQVSARNPDGSAAMPQQRILLKVMPVFFAVISIGFPAALVVYWVTSSLYRIGLQAYITRSLYGEGSLGQEAVKASSDARKGGKASDNGSASTDDSSDANRKSTGKAKDATKAAGAASPKSKDRSSDEPPGEIVSRRVTPPKPHPSSKKKKKRRR